MSIIQLKFFKLCFCEDMKIFRSFKIFHFYTFHYSFFLYLLIWKTEFYDNTLQSWFYLECHWSMIHVFVEFFGIFLRNKIALLIFILHFISNRRIRLFLSKMLSIYEFMIFFWDHPWKSEEPIQFCIFQSIYFVF